MTLKTQIFKLLNKNSCLRVSFGIKNTLSIIQSNLRTTITLGTQNLWPLLTGGRYLEVVVNSGLTVIHNQKPKSMTTN